MFTHLHVHSHYSLLDGLAKIDELLNKTKKQGLKSLALTDHGTMYGTIEFYQKARELDIKPIIGVEAYVARHGHKQKRPRLDISPYHLVLLAKNETGYRNLLKLTTKAHLEGFYYKPRVDFALLEKYNEGIIALSACLQGEISVAALSDKPDQAREAVARYQKIFGAENFYLEVQDHPNIAKQKTANDFIAEIAQKTNAPLVATNDTHYLGADDDKVHDVLMCIQKQRTVTDENRLSMVGTDFSLRDPQDMIDSCQDYPEATANTLKIAEQCNVEIKLGESKLPLYPVPKEKSTDDYLRELCVKGLDKRYRLKDPEKITSDKEKEIIERLDYELSVISKTNFSSYFLIVQDIVNWAKDNGIVVGPGRGSAGGSLVAYLLNITDVDPIKYNLLFERFLNPERISMPDIDLDFADIRRDEVIEYTRQKYGRDKVAQIITFGTMAARAAIRDCGRALGYPYDFCDKIAKLIPMFNTLEEALRAEPELRELYNGDPQAKKLIDYSQKLEGVARHASTHACGTVISPDKLDTYIPLQKASQDDSSIITQYEMHAVEDLGLLKMDFLGLKNLSIIEKALQIIDKVKKINIDIQAIPLDDKNAYELFQKGQTTGVFQFESAGMKRYLKQLKPTEFEDLIAMVSLYRPGPMDWIPDYIDGKHGRREIKYIHPKLKPILKHTYGVAIYQEQVMQIARDLAGFTLAEADVLRKAVGKKIKKLLLEQKKKFIDGCVANDIPKKTAQRVFTFIEPFAGYGFNRCLTGDTIITNAKTGSRYKLAELHNRYRNKQTLPTVLTLKDNLKLDPGKITKIFANGVKEVFEVKTRLGKTIKATANHPFRTIVGWQKLSQVKTGDRIATARKFPFAKKPLKIERHKLIVLGYLIAEGNLCHPASFYFYSKNKQELAEYSRNLNKFRNTKAKINDSKSAISVYAGRINLKKKSQAVEWVKSIGIHYVKAISKTLPSLVFKLNRDQLALLIGKMFQGDGCINLARKYPQIYYATSSKKLVEQLQHLLLRLDIISTIHIKKFKYRGGIKIGYTLTINRYNNIHNFLNGPGKYLIEQMARDAKKIAKQHPILNGTIGKNAARGSKDIIPIAVINLLRQGIKQSGYTFKEFAKKFKLAEGLFYHDRRKKGYLRETLLIIGQTLKNRQIMELAQSDIYWDEIVSIKKVGKEKTYDLTIASTHNFLANDFIVHNSHGACYAMIAYQTAYLKAKYPTEFMAALLTADQENNDRVAIEITECEQMGLEVLPPDVNESFGTFAVVPGTKNIRFAFSAIKNLGNNIIELIVEERKANGKFADLNDFLQRVSSKDLNKKSLESLAMSGALDQLTERKQVLANMERILEYIKTTSRANAAGQTDLFGSLGSADQAAPGLKLEPVEPASKKEKLAWEKELLGLYVSENPLEEYKEFLAANTVPFKDIPQKKSDQVVKVGGVVNKAKKIITKKNQPMLFVELENGLDKLEVIVFPSVLERNHNIWEEGKIVLVEGKLNDRDGEMKILCDEVREIDQELIDKWDTVRSMRGNDANIPARNASASVAGGQMSTNPDQIGTDEQIGAGNQIATNKKGAVKIRIPTNASPTLFHQLKKIFTAHQGKQRVILRVPEENGNMKEVKTNYLVDYSDEMAEKLKKEL